MGRYVAARYVGVERAGTYFGVDRAGRYGGVDGAGKKMGRYVRRYGR